MNEQHNNSGRPAEIENLSNRFLIHPLSNALAPLLARAGVHPNLISITGALAGMVAAWIYATPDAGQTDWQNALLALACMILWLVLDGADGQVARLTGKASATGRVVDAIADYWVFIVVYVALIYVSAPEYGIWATIAGLTAGVAHIVQAALYELQREKYVAWTKAEGPLPEGRTPQGEAWQEGTFWWLEWGYVRMQRIIGGAGITVPETPNPEYRAEIASLYRAHYAPHVHHWGILSSNSHALAIFAFVVAGWPLGYFLFEIVVMTLAMVLLLWRTRKLDRVFTRLLAAKYG